MTVEIRQKHSIFKPIFSPLLFAFDCWLHLHVGIQVEVSTKLQLEIRGCWCQIRYVSLFDDVDQFKAYLTIDLFFTIFSFDRLWRGSIRCEVCTDTLFSQIRPVLIEISTDFCLIFGKFAFFWTVRLCFFYHVLLLIAFTLSILVLQGRRLTVICHMLPAFAFCRFRAHFGVLERLLTHQSSSKTKQHNNQQTTTTTIKEKKYTTINRVRVVSFLVPSLYLCLTAGA